MVKKHEIYKIIQNNQELVIKINPYPFDCDSAFAICIDDIHPESINDEEGLDFGGDMDKGNFRFINELTDRYPFLKITLFVTSNWLDRPDSLLRVVSKKLCFRKSYPSNKFNLSYPIYTKWVEWLNNTKLEIALHGLTHHNPNIDYSWSSEFSGLSKLSTIESVEKSIKIINQSGLKYIKGFRPPGWGYNSFLFEELDQKGFIYYAASSDFHTPITKTALCDEGGLKNLHMIQPTFNNSKSALFFTANCYSDQIRRAIEISKLGGIVLIQAHITKTFVGLKSLNLKFVKNIETMLRELKFCTLNKIWFATLGEIAEFLIAKEKLEYKITTNEIIFHNKSCYDIHGLTVYVNNLKYIFNIKSNDKFTLNLIKEEQKSPKVSLILTVYNGEKTVIESIESIAKQDYRNIEIIIIDDGSTDNTFDLLKEYINQSRDFRILLIRQENEGRSKSKNMGIKYSIGDIIGFCEDDAIYAKNYVINAIRHFKDISVGGVIGPHYVWNKFGSYNTRIKDMERRRNFHNYKPKSCWFYRREDLMKVGGFNENIEFGEDIEPAIKLAEKNFRFQYEPNSLWLHRESSSFKNQIKRKFKGGLGMALLNKVGVKKKIINYNYYLILCMLLGFLIIELYYITFNLFVSILYIIIFINVSLLIRIKDIKKTRPLTDEKLLFIIIGIFVEYIWWIATFVGIMYGSYLSKDEINRILKGR